jgi:hypothetical protein
LRNGALVVQETGLYREQGPHVAPPASGASSGFRRPSGARPEFIGTALVSATVVLGSV